MHRFLRLTTYLTPTSVGIYGNNGEYGQNSSRKGTNNTQKQLNVDIKIFGLRLGITTPLHYLNVEDYLKSLTPLIGKPCLVPNP